MTATEKKTTLVNLIEAGETVTIKTTFGGFKVKKTYKVWKEVGADMFRVLGNDAGLAIRSGKTDHLVVGATY